jgi:hypothetical protein
MDRVKAGESLARLVEFAELLRNDPSASRVSWVLGEAKILAELTHDGWRPDDLAALADHLVAEHQQVGAIEPR